MSLRFTKYPLNKICLFLLFVILVSCTHNTNNRFIAEIEKKVEQDQNIIINSSGIVVLVFFDPFDCNICLDEINDLYLTFMDNLIEYKFYTNYKNENILKQFSNYNNAFQNIKILERFPFEIEGTPLTLIFKNGNLEFYYYNQQNWKSNLILHKKIESILH